MFFFSLWLVPFQRLPQRITAFHFNLFFASSTLTPPSLYPYISSRYYILPLESPLLHFSFHPHYDKITNVSGLSVLPPGVLHVQNIYFFFIP